MTPTLGMAVQREAAIAAFSPEQFYTVRLNANGINLDSQRFSTREDAAAILSACKNAEYAMIHSVTRKEHAEKPPALHDLTTLQRDANRLLGFTAQQALDYTQSLYEKKLVTYPRTDSRYLTEDMEPTLAQLVPQVAALLHVSGEVPLRPEQVMNNHKVTDHHAIIPTLTLTADAMKALPKGERELLKLIAVRLLCSVGAPYRFTEVNCHSSMCRRRIHFHRKKKASVKAGKALQNSIFQRNRAIHLPSQIWKQTQFFRFPNTKSKRGKRHRPSISPKICFLQAMETACADEFPSDAERKGIEPPRHGPQPSKSW